MACPWGVQRGRRGRFGGGLEGARVSSIHRGWGAQAGVSLLLASPTSCEPWWGPQGCGWEGGVWMEIRLVT